MNKHPLYILVACLLSACATAPGHEVAEPSGKLGVVQVGTKQNAELVFCEVEKCPQRTPKYLPPPPAPPAPVAIQTPVPVEVIEAPVKAQFKVHFRWGWGRLDNTGRKEIQEIVSSGLLKNGNSIVVAGRTDPTGPLQFNKKLALRRAMTVRTALVQAGFPAESITAEVQAPCCNGDLRSSKEVMQELRRTDIDITITTK